MREAIIASTRSRSRQGLEAITDCNESSATSMKKPKAAEVATFTGKIIQLDNQSGMLKPEAMVFRMVGWRLQK